MEDSIEKIPTSVYERPLLNNTEDEEIADESFTISSTLKRNTHISIKDAIEDRIYKRPISDDETPLFKTNQDMEKSNSPTGNSFVSKVSNKKMRKSNDRNGNPTTPAVKRNGIESMDNMNEEIKKEMNKTQQKMILGCEEKVAATVVNLCKKMKENIFTYMLHASDSSTTLKSYIPKIKKLSKSLKMLEAAANEVQNLNEGLDKISNPNPMGHIQNIYMLIENVVCQAATKVTEDMVYRNVNRKVLLHHYNLYRTERLKKLQIVRKAIEVFRYKEYKFRKFVEEANEDCDKEIKYIKKQEGSLLFKVPLKRSAMEETSCALCPCNKIQKMGSSSSSESSEDSASKSQKIQTNSLEFLNSDSVLKTLLLKDFSCKSGETSMIICKSSDKNKIDSEGLHNSSNTLKILIKLKDGMSENIENSVEGKKFMENKSILCCNSTNSSNIPSSQGSTRNYDLQDSRKKCHSPENIRVFNREPGSDILQDYHPQVPNTDSHLTRMSPLREAKDQEQQHGTYGQLSHDINVQCKPQNLGNQCYPGTLKDCQPHNLKNGSEPHSMKYNNCPQSMDIGVDTESLKNICTSSENIRNSQNLKNDCDPQSLKIDPQSLDNDLNSEILMNICKGLKSFWNSDNLKNNREAEFPNCNIEFQSLNSNREAPGPSNNVEAPNPSNNVEAPSPGNNSPNNHEVQCLSKNRESYDPLEGCSHHYSDTILESSTVPSKQNHESENQSTQSETNYEYPSSMQEIPMEVDGHHKSSKAASDQSNSNGTSSKYLYCEIKKPLKPKKKSKPKVSISERLLALEEFNDYLWGVAFELRDHYLTLEREFSGVENFFVEYLKSERGPILLLHEFLKTPMPNLFKKS